MIVHYVDTVLVPGGVTDTFTCENLQHATTQFVVTKDME